MRKILFSVTFLFYFLFSSSISFSQISTFDTSYVICSSEQFDYTNPKTTKFSNIYPGFQNWLIFEKKTSSYSNIAVREMTYDGYGPEILITNDTDCFNLNPNFDNDIIVWQSNKYGNWDIFFSQYNNGTWSLPIRLDSTLSEETEPYVLFNPIGSNQDYFYYLVF